MGDALDDVLVLELDEAAAYEEAEEQEEHEGAEDEEDTCNATGLLQGNGGLSWVREGGGRGRCGWAPPLPRPRKDFGCVVRRQPLLRLACALV